LYWSAVLNGVAAVPMLAMVRRLASRRDVVGRLTNGIVLNTLGWCATALMAVAVGVMVFDLVSCRRGPARRAYLRRTRTN
ncbi:hypothetical protein AAHH78_39750, partial [Burkholderia pseudomallei]